MRSYRWRVLLAGGVLLVTAGCATKDEWATWAAHPSHFASKDHLTFSMRNPEGATPRVTRADLEIARSQAWWGKAVTVDQGEILER